MRGNKACVGSRLEGAGRFVSASLILLFHFLLSQKGGGDVFFQHGRPARVNAACGVRSEPVPLDQDLWFTLLPSHLKHIERVTPEPRKYWEHEGLFHPTGRLFHLFEEKQDLNSEDGTKLEK